MTDDNHEQANRKQKVLGRLRDGSLGGSEGLRGSQEDELDRVLDAALAKYAAVDPRPGLEERVLAHLRTKPEPHSWMARRLWTAAGFALATIVIAVGLAMTWRTGRDSHPIIANRPPAPSQPQPQPATRVAANRQSGTQGSKQVPKISIRRVNEQPEIAVAPKLPRLDQFPSPEPLSDQEKLLASYISQYPERAAQLAELRMHALRQDAEEHRRLAAQDSQQ